MDDVGISKYFSIIMKLFRFSILRYLIVEYSINSEFSLQVYDCIPTIFCRVLMFKTTDALSAFERRKYSFSRVDHEFLITIYYFQLKDESRQHAGFFVMAHLFFYLLHFGIKFV